MKWLAIVNNKQAIPAIYPFRYRPLTLTVWGVATLVYVSIFAVLYLLLGPVVAPLSLVPVAIVGWFMGLRAGLFAALLSFPLHVFLLKLDAQTGWEALLLGAGLTGSVVVVGSGVGLLSELNRRVTEQASELASQRKALKERERAEETLRKSEELFRRLVEHAGDAFLLYDDQGKLINVNQCACDSLGYSREELLALSLPDVEVSRSSAEMPEVCRELVVGVPVTIEGIHRRRDGTAFPVEARLCRVKGDEGPLFLCLARDISERKRVEEELKLSNEALKRQEAELRRTQEFNHRLIASMPTAMVVVKPSLEVVFANRAFYKILGLKTRKIEGKCLTDILHLNDIKPLISATLKSRGSLKGREAIYLHPRVGRRWFRISATRLLDRRGQSPDKEDTNLVLSLDDITEWRQTQENIQEISRLVSLGEIVASVAHELNNPLASIMGFTQFIIEREPEGPNKSELEMVYSEAQRAAKVVRNLLSFVRKHKAEKGWVDLSSTLERVLALRSYDLHTSNIKVETFFAPDLPPAYVDKHGLEQVFLNIVTNAQQALAEETPPGGRLSIRAYKDDGVIRVSFQDDGSGIPLDNLKVIFEPLFTTKAPGEGTGLGLSICKSLIQDEGGKIWAESEIGKGAMFHVELPIRER